MRYGVLIEDFTEVIGEKYRCDNLVGMKAKDVFVFNRTRSRCFVNKLLNDKVFVVDGHYIPQDVAVEISESEYNRLKPTPKTHTITLDGKEFTISHELYLEAKRVWGGII